MVIMKDDDGDNKDDDGDDRSNVCTYDPPDHFSPRKPQCVPPQRPHELHLIQEI